MRRLIISDIHLGPIFQREIPLISLLRQDWDEVIVAGDFFELLGFQTKKEIEKQFKCILTLLSKQNTVFLNGNHDPIYTLNDYSFNLSNGKKVLIVHGHQFDTPTSSFYVKFNLLFYKIFGFEIRRIFRFFVSYKSLVIKTRDYYKDKCDILIMGHTHRPMKDTDYYNCGDWIENCSYIIIENNDISLVVIK